MQRNDTASSSAPIVQWFAEQMVDSQLDQFHHRFGRVPRGHEPLFFAPDASTPEPMPLREVLAVVTGAAMAEEELELGSVEDARAFSILVLMKLGLDGEAIDEALTGTGRFLVH